MKKCPKCGNMAEGKFCPECGADLASVAEIYICPKCGAESTSKFCPECGTSLTDSSATPAQPLTVTEPLATEGNNAETGNAQSTYTEAMNTASQGNVPESPKKSKKILIIIGAVVVGIIILILIIGALGGGDSTSTSGSSSSSSSSSDSSDYSSSDSSDSDYSSYGEFTEEGDYMTVEYDKLARTPDDYEGDKIKVSGEAIQVIEGDGVTELRIATDEYYDDVVLVYYDSDIIESRVLEDDDVTVYGISEGLYTYESTNGGDITVPYMYVQKVVIN